ncbi:hypothetical protein CCR80_14005 [Rhodothalassium salexigens]|nr:hypothetical protein [Rhodothalassium salexigens]
MASCRLGRSFQTISWGQKMRKTNHKHNSSVTCEACPVRPFTICRFFEGPWFDALSEAKYRDQIADKGEILYKVNDKSDFIFFQISGWSKSFCYLKNGARQVIDINYPGALLGFSQSNDAPHQYGLQAITKSRFCLMPKKRFLEVIRRDVDLMNSVIFWLDHERNRALGRLRSICQRSAKQRIAGLLLELYARAEQNPLISRSNRLNIPLTQDDIGDLVSITTVRVNQLLKQLQRDGVIDYGRSFYELRDLGHLSAIADGVRRTAGTAFMAEYGWVAPWGIDGARPGVGALTLPWLPHSQPPSADVGKG